MKKFLLPPTTSQDIDKNPKYVEAVSISHEQNSSHHPAHQRGYWHGGYSEPKASLPLAWDLPRGRSWARTELFMLLGSFFCISSLHGGMAIGSSSLWGPQGEPAEGLGCCPTLTPCGEAKGSRHLHVSTVKLSAKVPLTAPPSKLPSSKPAT